MANAATLKPSKPQPSIAAIADAVAFPATPRFAMLSHRGRVRHANQDACGALPEHGAFVVCDGVGGAAAGDVASHLASEAFLNSIGAPRRIAPRAASSSAANHAGIGHRNGDCPYPANDSRSRLEEAVRAANQAVFRHSRKSPRLHGMGTTLVAALLDGATGIAGLAARMGSAPTLWLAHVGDSRAYLFRHGELHPLTRDHSLVEEQVSAGLLSRVQAGSSPIRNIITRAIGSQPTVEPDIAVHPSQPGDVCLLTSDGLTRELDDTQIAGILEERLARIVSPAALETACHALVDAANAHGGQDNITVLLIAVP
jgi:protein phosphatase